MTHKRQLRGSLMIRRMDMHMIESCTLHPQHIKHRDVIVCLHIAKSLHTEGCTPENGKSKGRWARPLFDSWCISVCGFTHCMQQT